MSHYGSANPSQPKPKSGYTASRIESDLRKTLSFLARTLQNEFLDPKAGQAHRSADSPYARTPSHGAGKSKWEDLPFDEILLKGKRKVEKLVRKYRELNPTTADAPSRHDRTAYNENSTREYDPQSSGGRWQQADEIEEVESVRSSRHRGSRHSHAPRVPSPPRAGYHRSHTTSRDAHDWAGSNPEYYSATSDPYTHPSPTTAPAKRKSTGFSLDKINLPALIAHAGVILEVIEKVLAVKSGGGHGSRGASGGSGGLHTAVKVVRMVVALSEGLGLARPQDSRRHTY